MKVELINHFIEMSKTYYDVERVDEEKFGNCKRFRFYFGKGKYSREYQTPTYTYTVIEN